MPRCATARPTSFFAPSRRGTWRGAGGSRGRRSPGKGGTGVPRAPWPRRAAARETAPHAKLTSSEVSRPQRGDNAPVAEKYRWNKKRKDKKNYLGGFQTTTLSCKNGTQLIVLKNRFNFRLSAAGDARHSIPFGGTEAAPASSGEMLVFTRFFSESRNLCLVLGREPVTPNAVAADRWPLVTRQRPSPETIQGPKRPQEPQHAP